MTLHGGRLKHHSPTERALALRLARLRNTSHTGAAWPHLEALVLWAPRLQALPQLKRLVACTQGGKGTCSCLLNYWARSIRSQRRAQLCWRSSSQAACLGMQRQRAQRSVQDTAHTAGAHTCGVGVHDVLAGGCERGVEEGGDGDDAHVLGRLRGGVYSQRQVKGSEMGVCKPANFQCNLKRARTRKSTHSSTWKGARTAAKVRLAWLN